MTAIHLRNLLALFLLLTASGCLQHRRAHSMKRVWADWNTLGEPAIFFDTIDHLPYRKNQVSHYRWMYGIDPGHQYLPRPLATANATVVPSGMTTPLGSSLTVPPAGSSNTDESLPPLPPPPRVKEEVSPDPPNESLKPTFLKPDDSKAGKVKTDTKAEPNAAEPSRLRRFIDGPSARRLWPFRFNGNKNSKNVAVLSNEPASVEVPDEPDVKSPRKRMRLTRFFSRKKTEEPKEEDVGRSSL